MSSERAEGPPTDLNWRLTMYAPMAVLEIASGIVTLVTLTRVTPKWTLDYAFWRSRLRYRRKQATRG